MRNPIEQLANTERERLSIRRVDFNKHASLARQLGVSVCPSYIAFHKGKEVFRAAYPTSSDLIAAGLDAALRSASTE
jgi:thioredoxin-like negative regulator of GroEL